MNILSSNKKIKNILLTFSFFLLVMTVSIFIYNLEWGHNIDFLPTVLIFDRFLHEYIIVAIILSVFLGKYRILTFIGILIFIVYVGIVTSQTIGFLISGEFLSKLALDNVEFIGLMYTWDNISIVLYVLILLILLPAMASYYLNSIHKIQWFSSKIFLGIILFIVILASKNIKIVSSETLEKRDTLLKENNFPHSAPIQALFKTIRVEKVGKFTFNAKEISTLRSLGFIFNPFSRYPLIKDTIYDKSKSFQHPLDKPNIILIFTEGLSARTTSVYSDKYPNLTPNLKAFSEHPTVTKVSNFYNHTAATYRGLHGQLCSLYPFLGGGKYWFENDLLNLSKNNYKCLPHVLKNNGYETTYLNMHYEGQSANGTMVSYFGFDKIISGEELSKTYLNGMNRIRTGYLDDHQAYNVLIKYLENKEKMQNKPFLLTTYTVETHAFVDITSSGVAYKDGKNNIFNTIHNMDDAFGKFWNYFKNSKYAKNTIIVFTSDHAHFQNKKYVTMMKKNKEEDYKYGFIDRVPFIVYSPKQLMPSTIDANGSTSIDMSSTLLHYLNVDNEKNSFLGQSLFEKNRNKIGVSSYGRHLRILQNTNSDTVKLLDKFIKYTHYLERENRIYPKKKD
jgi:membrane-anchored protein YejM (alkaline phosphatase superfamily)